jgi:hypothetical protein
MAREWRPSSVQAGVRAPSLLYEEGVCWGLDASFPWLLRRISSARRTWGTFVRSSAEVPGKTNVNAFLVLPSECRDQVSGGGREKRMKEPSDLPTMKDGRRQYGGRSRTDKPSEHPGQRPSTWPGQGTFVTSTPKVPRPNEGSKCLTNWSLRQGAHEELTVRIYLSDLWSVDCNIWICRDISPPSWSIFLIALGPFLSPIKRGWSHH